MTAEVENGRKCEVGKQSSGTKDAVRGREDAVTRNTIDLIEYKVNENIT